MPKTVTGSFVIFFVAERGAVFIPNILTCETVVSSYDIDSARYSPTLKVNWYSSTFMEPEVSPSFPQKLFTGPYFKLGEASLCLFTLFLQY